MLTIVIIAFREFLEAFLIIGVFLGLSRKLKIHKERALKISAFLAFSISLLVVAPFVFSFSSDVKYLVNSGIINALQAALAIVSAIFIPITVFSLHGITGKFTHNTIKQIQANARAEVDWSTFIPIILFFLVLKEGIEAVFFNLSVSLTNPFNSSLGGFILGFFIAGLFGILTSRLYTRLPMKKIYKITEVFLILVGANYLQEGLSIFANRFHFSFDPYVVLIDLIYIILVYVYFIKEDTISTD